MVALLCVIGTMKTIIVPITLLIIWMAADLEMSAIDEYRRVHY